MKEHLKSRIFKIITLVVVCLNINLIFCQISLENLKKWDYNYRGTEFKNRILKINDEVLNQNFKIIAVHDLPIKLELGKEYQIEIEISIDSDVEVGILISKSYKNEKINSELQNIYPHVVANLKSKNDSGKFIATGFENKIFLFMRKSQTKGKTKKQEVIVKSIKILQLKEIEETTNLISNGNFEKFHLLAYSYNSETFYLTGFFPFWNNNVDSSRVINVNTPVISEIEGTNLSVSDKYSSLLLGTPDIYRSTVEKKSFSGNIYAGINLISSVNGNLQRGREYLQTPLIRKLEEGENLKISFACKFDYARSNGFATNGMGILISEKPEFKKYPDDLKMISDSGQFSPKILSEPNWIVLEFYFSAKGGEEFLTIGDFNNSNLMLDNNYPENFISYYYIDNIEVISLGK